MSEEVQVRHCCWPVFGTAWKDYYDEDLSLTDQDMCRSFFVTSMCLSLPTALSIAIIFLALTQTPLLQVHTERKDREQAPGVQDDRSRHSRCQRNQNP